MTTTTTTTDTHRSAAKSTANTLGTRRRQCLRTRLRCPHSTGSAGAQAPRPPGVRRRIARTIEEIVRGDYMRIALQLPDELLADSGR